MNAAGRLAVIPARGGSKRIPRKNIKPFAGKPMLAYAIDAARASGLFEHVVVSTDDEEIAAIASGHGAELPFVRPAELSDDHTGTTPVIAHAIQACTALGWNVQQVCCIYPGVPMIEANDLREAHRMLCATDSEYVFAVAAFPSAVQRALRRGADGRMAPFYVDYLKVRTQDLEPGYYDAGQFYFGSADAWIRGQSPHQNGLGLVIPEWRAVDIDTAEDWRRAELLYQALHASN